jgi:hypothetical protein
MYLILHLSLSTKHIHFQTVKSEKGTMLKYYVSNILLEKADRSSHVIPQDESYILIDESIESIK